MIVDKDGAESSQWWKAQGMMEGKIKGRLDTVLIRRPEASWSSE